MTTIQSDKQKIFISYSRLDSAVVGELIDDLESLANVRIFRDTQDIMPTEKWKARLEQLIVQADTIVFALSPHSAISEVCRWEVEYAEGLNKRIAPVVIETINPAIIPTPLTKYNYIFFTEEHDRQIALANLKTALTVNIDWIREHTRLGELALRWHRGGCSNAVVLRGKVLSEAETWLSRQPLEAPSPTNLHNRFIMASRKAASRRQKFWIAGALTIAALSGGLAVLSEFNRRQAVAERQRVERVLERTTEATKELVIEIANRYAMRKNVPKALTIAVLQQARKLVAELETVGEAGSALQMNGALALAELSDALRINGEREEALSTAQASVLIFRQLNDSSTKSSLAQSGLFLALDRQGDIHWDLANYRMAEASWREAEKLAKIFPISPATIQLKSIAFENIGTLYMKDKDHRRALEIFFMALKMRRDTSKTNPNIQTRRGEAVLLEKIAEAHNVLGQSQEATTALVQSFELASSIAAARPNNTGYQEDLATAHMSLANIYLKSNKLNKVTRHLDAYQAIVTALHASDPPWRVWRQMLMVGNERLASLYYLQNDLDRARRFFKSAYDQASALALQDPSQRDWLANVSKLAQSLTLVMLLDGKPEAALKEARSAIDIVRSAITAGADAHDHQADLLNNAAWYALFAKKPAEALRFADDALALYPENLLYLPNRAHALAMLGRMDDARAIYNKYRGKSLEDGRIWETVLISDFDTMSSLGLTVPGQKNIEDGLKQ